MHDSHRKTIKISLSAIAAIVIVSFTIGYAMRAGSPPPEFVQARINAVSSANQLALLVNNSIANLEKVTALEKQEQNIEALTLIGFEFQGRQEKQNAAVLLAARLDQMAKLLPRVANGEARSSAVQAITSGITMVSRIVHYNSNLDLLFSALQEKIETGRAPENAAMSNIAGELNRDAEAINTLNKDLNRALEEFDNAYDIVPSVDSSYE